MVLADLNLRLQRRPSTDVSTLGDLFVDDAHECLSLEDVIREPALRPAGLDAAALDAWVRTWKVDHQTAIPAGRYRVIIDWSERFQKWMIHILDVPGFTGIRLHAGDTAAQTDGCVLAGTASADGRTVQGSTSARDAVLLKIAIALAVGRAVWIDIVNPPAAA